MAGWDLTSTLSSVDLAPGGTLSTRERHQEQDLSVGHSDAKEGFHENRSSDGNRGAPLMPLSDYIYCKIFAAKANEGEISEVTLSTLGVQSQGKSIEVNDLLIEVRRNPDSRGDKNFDEDFLYWPTLVELELQDHSQLAMLTEKVTLLLHSLWGESIPAVAACNFEDQLPWGGGMRRDFSTMRDFR